ncbi:metal dependent phosphohydrolase [Cadophora sp. MPI-SDFR-AT-0126]|nr:metal dependent phosphohydrolase [Leotiomycetes sp. MPI-SDFR-AT-0126]
MSSSDSPLPDLPKSGIRLPQTPLILGALEHLKKITSPITVNHCVRSAYFAVLVSRKLPRRGAKPLDVELIVYSNIMHDLGWATDKSLLSKNKRFEVDGANMARAYLEEEEEAAAGGWDQHRVQLMWDAIALHATGSFALHKEPEVAIAHIGVMVDFFGPDYPGELITVDEYKEVIRAFPRAGFSDQFLQIMCGLCAFKPETTYDNLVADFGSVYGMDGNGTGKEEFAKNRVPHTWPRTLYPAIAACDKYEED